MANSGTGREWRKCIPTFRELKWNEKKTFLKFGNGKGMKKNIPIIREREGNKKSIPEILEREWREKIHSHNLGTGIRAFHSWEWTGTGVPAHPCTKWQFWDSVEGKRFCLLTTHSSHDSAGLKISLTALCLNWTIPLPQEHSWYERVQKTSYLYFCLNSGSRHSIFF